MIDQLTQSLQVLGEKVTRLKETINTEEATKTALIKPFIMALGYDVFDPTEVVPEYVADVGIKKGEKIDYAIIREGKPIIIFECKHWKEKLELHHSQLFRYFHTLHARFAILTNGIDYRFYTDLNEPNKMDDIPFLEVNITSLRDVYIKEIVKFHKHSFDENAILTTAQELRYTTRIRKYLQNNVFTPSEDFIRLVLKSEYDGEGKVTQKIVENFEPIIKRSIDQYLSDLISNRLKAALVTEQKAQGSQIDSSNDESDVSDPQDTAKDLSQDKEKDVITTIEELEGFFIIKNILRSAVEVNRVTYRDKKNFFSVLIDDNNRKTVCKLFMDGKPFSLSISDADKKEIKYSFEKLDEIYNFEKPLIASARRFI